MKAIVADPVGGPENLKYEDLPRPEPKQGQALVKVEAIGVNFIDVYFRNGHYKTPETPVLLGNEGAGTIVTTSPGSNFPVGARVAWAMSRGSYAEYAVVPVSNLVAIPETVSFENAAAMMLQGMTAHYLTRSTFALRPGHTCLVHAAAGGAGLLTRTACQTGRRSRHRHGFHSRKNQARPGSRSRRDDPVHGERFRRRGETHHRR